MNPSTFSALNSCIGSPVVRAAARVSSDQLASEASIAGMRVNVSSSVRAGIRITCI